MNVESTETLRLNDLAEELTERLRRGERPDLETYVARHPELEAPIRQLFPLLTILEGKSSRPERPTALRALSVPERLGDFLIHRELGRGGGGIVFEAEQRSLGRRVALKVVWPEALTNEVQRQRFHREARTAARLHHTNLVPVLGIGEDQGFLFCAMQLIDGRSLSDWLREWRTEQSLEHDQTALDRARPSPGSADWFRCAAQLGLQAAEGLAHAHMHGVLHRDIKPANLLLDKDNTVWISDFGLAKADDLVEVTETGNVVGTIAYLAPERLRGQTDARSDVYSLGLTLYELLLLQPAFAATQRAELLHRIGHGSPPRPRTVDPSLPRDLETLLLKATAREPDQRYQTAGALAEDLRRFLEERPILARPVPAWERTWRWCRRNPVVATLTAALIVSLLVGVTATSWQALHVRRQWLRAEENFAKARIAVDECFDKVTEDAAFEDPGALAAREVLLRSALRYYQEFLQQRGQDDTIRADLAHVYHRVGHITRLIGSRSEAIQAYEQARQLREYLGRLSPEDSDLRAGLVSTLLALGDLYRAENRSQEAEKVYRQALVEIERIPLLDGLPANPRYLKAEAQIRLAQVLAVTGRAPTALELLEALPVALEQLATERPDEARTRELLANCRERYAEVLGHNFDRAHDCIAQQRQAVLDWEELVRRHPKQVEYRRGLGQSYNRLAALLLDLGEKAGTGDHDIEPTWLKALTIYEELAREHPRWHGFRDMVARTWSNLGLFYSLPSQGRLARAEAAHLRALEIRKQLVRHQPDANGYRVALAKSFQNLGLMNSWYARWELAEDHLYQSLRIMEPLVAAKPPNSNHISQMVICLLELARISLYQEVPSVALRLTQQAQVQMDLLLRIDPEGAFSLRFQKELCHVQAMVLLQLGRLEDAERCWQGPVLGANDPSRSDGTRLGLAMIQVARGQLEEANATAHDIRKRHPNGARQFIDVARLHLRIAAALRRDGTAPSPERVQEIHVHHRLAIEALRLMVQPEAPARGWFYHRLLSTTKELAPLRDYPEFQQMLAELTERAKTVLSGEPSGFQG